MLGHTKFHGVKIAVKSKALLENIHLLFMIESFNMIASFKEFIAFNFLISLLFF